MARRTMLFTATLVFIVASSICQGKTFSTRSVSEEYDCPYNSGKCHGALDSQIYYNGIIYTVDKESESNWATNPQEAIVVEKGIIKFVGSKADAETHKKSDTVMVDLEGKTVLPGIHDVHMHPLEAGSPVGGTCLLPSGTDPAEMKLREIIDECASEQVGTEWLLGWGHSITSMLDYIVAGGSPKQLLDDVLPDTPVVFMEETSHSVWVNSAALRKAGIDANTSDIPGGIIMKDSSGEPNGILLENAGNAIMEHAYDPVEYPELEKLNYEGMLYALEEMAKYGITSGCDARVYWSRNHDKAWEKALDEDTLTARMVLDLWAYPQKDDQEQIRTLKSMYSNDPKSLLRKSQVKVYSDGLIDATTAAVFEPYLEDLGIITDNLGLNYFPEDRLAKLIRELQNVDENGGFDFNIHVIGDRGAYEALNAIENCSAQQQTPRRHRLTHLEIVDEEDRPRFKDLGVLADFQVSGDFTLPPGKEHIASMLGSERAEDFVPVKSLLDAGAHVTLSSDWDVSGLNPFVGLRNALRREHQSVDLKTAVEMYTINGAYLMRQENYTGSLTPGKAADLIIIDKNIFNISESEISYIKVLQTILEGNQIYIMGGGNTGNSCNLYSFSYLSLFIQVVVVVFYF